MQTRLKQNQGLNHQIAELKEGLAERNINHTRKQNEEKQALKDQIVHLEERLIRMAEHNNHHTQELVHEKQVLNSQIAESKEKQVQMAESNAHQTHKQAEEKQALIDQIVELKEKVSGLADERTRQAGEVTNLRDRISDLEEQLALRLTRAEEDETSPPDPSGASSLVEHDAAVQEDQTQGPPVGGTWTRKFGCKIRFSIN